MSVEGLRAWIGEVERKLGKRTRVFLALTVIAIGLAGASLYLAIEANDNSVSESEVRALQKEIEEGVAKNSITPAPAPETESAESEAQPTPRPEEPTPQKGGGKQSQSPQGGGGSGNGTSTAPNGATGGAASSAKLQELLEKAKQQNAEAEAKQGAK